MGTDTTLLLRITMIRLVVVCPLCTCTRFTYYYVLAFYLHAYKILYYYYASRVAVTSNFIYLHRYDAFAEPLRQTGVVLKTTDP